MMGAERFLKSRLFILEERRAQDDLISTFKYLRRLLTEPSLQRAEEREMGLHFSKKECCRKNILNQVC